MQKKINCHEKNRRILKKLVGNNPPDWNIIAKLCTIVCYSPCNRRDFNYILLKIKLCIYLEKIWCRNKLSFYKCVTIYKGFGGDWWLRFYYDNWGFTSVLLTTNFALCWHLLMKIKKIINNIDDELFPRMIKDSKNSLGNKLF